MGTTAGTAIIQILQRGILGDTFVDTSATGSVTPPTLYLPSAALQIQDNSVFINTQEPVVALGATGYRAITLGGTTAGGIIELVTWAADANSVTIGAYCFSDMNSTATDKRIAFIAATTQGGTSNNRGGILRLFTKPDGAEPVERERIDNLGNHGFNGATTFGTSAAGVLAFLNGTPPSTSPVATGFQQYSTSGRPTFRTGADDIIQLFKGAALTVASGGALSSGGAAVLSTADATILSNAITRISDLEARLSAVGLLP